MTVPVLVVSGFLGAGKTTFINRLLARSEGRRISAIVNDFGAINIDAELIADAADTVVGLKNGCICCSLQGDLLRTLKLVLSQPVKPDHIIVEASGVADPRGIVDALMDAIRRRCRRHRRHAGAPARRTLARPACRGRFRRPVQDPAFT